MLCWSVLCPIKTFLSLKTEFIIFTEAVRCTWSHYVVQVFEIKWPLSVGKNIPSVQAHPLTHTPALLKWLLTIEPAMYRSHPGYGLYSYKTSPECNCTSRRGQDKQTNVLTVQ